ncbi:MAG: hypothetical protein SF187_05690 [Deltaproteobacteria bacterium]|nr:hypothetical protein [Deltaproteobacteria bacterium]
MEDRDREIAQFIAPAAQVWDERREAMRNPERARDGFLRAASQRHTSKLHALRPWLLASSLGFAASVVAFIALRPTAREVAVPQPTSFAAHITPLPATGAWVTAALDRAFPMQFEEGTNVALQGGATAKIAANQKALAKIVLRSGRLRADVTPRVKHWDFVAGEQGVFVVEVTGTSFDMAWDAPAETLFVQMHHGQVRVHGDCLAKDIILNAGDAQDIRCPPQAAAAPAMESPPSSSPRPRDVVATAPWQSLVRAGDFAGAVRAISRLGLERNLNRLSAADAIAVGDALRLGGQQKRAARLYEHVWESSDDRAASIAAFTLGRMADEQSRSPTRASQWFARSYQRAPRGPMSEEAGWRHIESLKAAKLDAQAVAAARAFVKAHPSGAYTQLAQKLIAASSMDGMDRRP